VPKHGTLELALLLAKKTLFVRVDSACCKVHYSEECLRQLHDALQAGFRIHVDSVLLPQPLGFERIRHCDDFMMICDALRTGDVPVAAVAVE